jgi:hypothetical protein
MMRWHVDLKRQGEVRMTVKRMLFIALLVFAVWTSVNIVSGIALSEHE